MVEIGGLGAVVGVVVAFGTLLGLLLRAGHRDRVRYEAAVDRADERAAQAWAAVEAERAGRHACEDDASRLRSERDELRRRIGGGS